MEKNKKISKNKEKKRQENLKQEQILRVPAETDKKTAYDEMPPDKGNDYEIQRDNRENPIL